MPKITPFQIKNAKRDASSVNITLRNFQGKNSANKNANVFDILQDEIDGKASINRSLAVLANCYSVQNPTQDDLNKLEEFEKYVQEKHELTPEQLETFKNVYNLDVAEIDKLEGIFPNGKTTKTIEKQPEPRDLEQEKKDRQKALIEKQKQEQRERTQRIEEEERRLEEEEKKNELWEKEFDIRSQMTAAKDDFLDRVDKAKDEIKIQTNTKNWARVNVAEMSNALKNNKEKNFLIDSYAKVRTSTQNRKWYDYLLHPLNTYNENKLLKNIQGKLAEQKITDFDKAFNDGVSNIQANIKKGIEEKHGVSISDYATINTRYKNLEKEAEKLGIDLDGDEKSLDQEAFRKNLDKYLNAPQKDNVGKKHEINEKTVEKTNTLE